MPRYCSVCANTEASAISKALAGGASVRDVASRFGVTAASAHRHLVGCLRIRRKAEKSGCGHKRADSAVSSRFESESGRCSACGTVADDPKPEALVKRAERILWIAETIAAQAQRDDEARLALQGVDRARAAMELLMRSVGMLRSDDSNAGTSQTLNIFAGRSIEELEAVLSGLRVLGAGNSGGSHATDNRRLSEDSSPALAPASRGSP